MSLRVLLAGATPRLLESVRVAVGRGRPRVLLSEVDALAPARELLARTPHDLAVLAGGILGPAPVAAVEELLGLPEAPAVVVATAAAGARERARLLAAGAAAVLEEEAGVEALAAALGTILERRRSLRAAELRADVFAPDSRLADFATRSPTMRAFLGVVRKVLDSSASVLLLGETGVGKEYLAQALHNEGPRRAGPFVAINCAAVPESLVESELFGHKAGAFTGAAGAHRGYFELAHGGTLYLDEVGELPLPLQAKLLRVLEERSIRPLGDERTVDVDVRVLAATNRDVRAEVAAGRFREDLYYRLGGVTLTVPPLRERREDIPLLVESQVEHQAARMARRVLGVTPEALDALLRYPWPGNVRELVNVVERAVLLTDAEEIGLADLPDDVRAAAGKAARLPGEVLGPGTTEEQLFARGYSAARDALLEAFERRYFEALLGETGGRVGRAAERAGLTPRSLYAKMKKLGLRKEAFRPGSGRTR